MARLLDLEELLERRHFDHEIIVLCVRWYLRFKLSFRDLVERGPSRPETPCRPVRPQHGGRNPRNPGRSRPPQSARPHRLGACRLRGGLRRSRSLLSRDQAPTDPATFE